MHGSQKVDVQLVSLTWKYWLLFLGVIHDLLHGNIFVEILKVVNILEWYLAQFGEQYIIELSPNFSTSYIKSVKFPNNKKDSCQLRINYVGFNFFQQFQNSIINNISKNH